MMKNAIKTIAKDVFDDPGKYVFALGMTVGTVALCGVSIYYAAKGDFFTVAKGAGIVVPGAIIDYKMGIAAEDSPYNVIKKAIFE